MLKYIFLIIFIFFHINILTVDAGKVVELDLFQSCRPGMPEEYVNVTLRKDESRRTFVNATIVYSRDISNNLDESAEIYRCKSKESLDTCIYFTTIRLMNSCITISTGSNQFWTPFFDNIKPPITCPMKKGIHVMTNGWLDADRTPFPVDRTSYWKLYLKTKELPSKEEISCLEAAGRIIPAKNKG